MTQQHQLAPSPACDVPVWTGAGYRYEPRYRTACGRWLPVDRFDELITCRRCLRIARACEPTP